MKRNSFNVLFFIKNLFLSHTGHKQRKAHDDHNVIILREPV